MKIDYDFVCAICQEHCTWKHLAFTFNVEDHTEGVCGDCAVTE
jgi:hypothetical protein